MWEGALRRTFRTGSHVRGIEVTQKSVVMLNICLGKHGGLIDSNLQTFYDAGHVKKSI